MKTHFGDHEHHGPSDGVHLAPVDLLWNAAGTNVLHVHVKGQLHHLLGCAGQGKASLTEKRLSCMTTSEKVKDIYLGEMPALAL